MKYKPGDLRPRPVHGSADRFVIATDFDVEEPSSLPNGYWCKLQRRTVGNMTGRQYATLEEAQAEFMAAKIRGDIP